MVVDEKGCKILRVTQTDDKMDFRADDKKVDMSMDDRQVNSIWLRMLAEQRCNNTAFSRIILFSRRFL